MMATAHCSSVLALGFGARSMALAFGGELDEREEEKRVSNTECCMSCCMLWELSPTTEVPTEELRL